MAMLQVVDLEFQSTLPRGERLVNVIPLSRHNVVSIHAPARGATFPL